jgi:hypothetical protein
MSARPLRVIDSYADGPATLDAIWPTVPLPTREDWTQEIPVWQGLPELVATARCERPSLLRRIARSQFVADVRRESVVVGLALSALACLVPLAYAIAESGAR